MTAVPAGYGAGLQLICDGCGRSAGADGAGLHDADVVYVAVTAVGWSGSPFARGPHRCPRCSAVAAPAPRRPADVPGAVLDGAVLDRASVEVTPAAAIVRVAADLDAGVADELRSMLETAVAARRYVVVDLTEAGTIDSAGLGALVRARNAARRRSGELILAGPSRFVQTVLRTMRLHTAFRTFPSVEQAVAATPDAGFRPGQRALVPSAAGRAGS